MAKVIDLTTGTAKQTEEVNSILYDAKQMQFDEVFVFGFKDGMTHIRGSTVQNTLRTIGMLEMAKHELLK